MRVLIAGASGMVGSALARYLSGEGHKVVRLVRRAPGTGEVRWDPDGGTIDAAGLEGFDGVVNVASMRWPARWTAAAKVRMCANRLATNGILATTLARCRHKPRVLICASGMGIYPSSGDEVLTEESPLGSDFLAMLQRDGEAATAPASAAGIRLVNLRIPPVLGGAAVERGITRIDSGRQWMSWVARDELASIVQHALLNDGLEGGVNPVSPNPMRNAEFAATVSQVVGKRACLPIPAFLLRLMLGEMGESLVLASRRMQPAKLLASGYQFRFARLEDAVRHELAQPE